MDEENNTLKMTTVLNSLYGSNEIDSDNVSIHSAFICLLHIANEKGKSFQVLTIPNRTDTGNRQPGTGLGNI